jgi:hypothetical protein
MVKQIKISNKEINTNKEETGYIQKLKENKELLAKDKENHPCSEKIKLLFSILIKKNINEKTMKNNDVTKNKILFIKKGVNIEIAKETHPKSTSTINPKSNKNK